MTKKLLLLSILIPFIFGGCSKEEPIPKPIAEFAYTISPKGLVTFMNKSTHSDSFKWDFGDKGTSTERAPLYTYKTNDTFQVSLTVTGRGGSDVIVKSITINNIYGSLLVFKRSSSGRSPILVYVDQVYRGTINGNYYYSSVPECGNIYSVTVGGLFPGYHYVKAVESTPNGSEWTGTINIKGGTDGCDKIALD